VLANAADAATAQLDGLHALVQQWRGEMGEAEWQRLYVVILGPRMPRAGNLQFAYFANALGNAAIDQRLFYAEGIFDVKGGLDLLATIITDRELSAAVFDDPLRMDRDLLADGAAAHLLSMFGRLGPAERETALTAAAAVEEERDGCRGSSPRAPPGRAGDRSRAPVSAAPTAPG